MNSFYSIVLAAAVAAAPPLSEYSRYESLDNTKVAYGMGVETDSNNRPLGAIRAQKQYARKSGCGSRSTKATRTAAPLIFSIR